MKNLHQYIIEKIKISNNNMVSYKYTPLTRQQLIDIIDEKIKENPKIIDVSDIDISQLNKKNIGLVFSYNDIEEIHGLENWDVSEIIKMNELFSYCEFLKYVNGIEEWDVSNVKRFDGMFSNCRSLENLDISKWNISKDAQTEGMFDKCNMDKIKHK